jgi:hypothetical protein
MADDLLHQQLSRDTTGPRRRIPGYSLPVSCGVLSLLADPRKSPNGVRFTPKADICSATRDLRFEPKADICRAPVLLFCREILSARTRADALGAIDDRRHRIWVSTDDKRLIILYEIQERSLAGSFTRLHFAFDMATNYFEGFAK